MNKLIVPFDFSIHAENALGYALELAQQIEASVTIFHVFNVPVPAGYEDASLTYNMALASQEKQKRQQRLDTFLSNLGERHYIGGNKPLEIHTEVRQAELDASLQGFLKHNPHNLVVMGTKGMQGWEELLNEKSNTTTVAEMVDTSVLVVPLEAKYNGIHHIIYGLDFDKKDIEVIKEIADFNELFGGRVTCLHVSQASTEYTDQELLDALEEEVEKEGLENIDFVMIEDENVEKALFVFAQDNNADLLAVMPRERDFLDGLFHKSMTKQLTHHTTMPLLVIK